jgi:hypothetical protein
VNTTMEVERGQQLDSDERGWVIIDRSRFEQGPRTGHDHARTQEAERSRHPPRVTAALPPDIAPRRTDLANSEESLSSSATHRDHGWRSPSHSGHDQAGQGLLRPTSTRSPSTSNRCERIHRQPTCTCAKRW